MRHQSFLLLYHIKIFSKWNLCEWCSERYDTWVVQTDKRSIGVVKIGEWYGDHKLIWLKNTSGNQETNYKHSILEWGSRTFRIYATPTRHRSQDLRSWQERLTSKQLTWRPMVYISNFDGYLPHTQCRWAHSSWLLIRTLRFSLEASHWWAYNNYQYGVVEIV